MLSKGSGELSGTSRMRKPLSMSAAPTASIFGRRNAAQHRDERQRTSGYDVQADFIHSVSMPAWRAIRHKPARRRRTVRAPHRFQRARARDDSARNSAASPSSITVARSSPCRASQRTRRGNLGPEQQTRKVIGDARRRKRFGQRQRPRGKQVVRQRRILAQAVPHSAIERGVVGRRRRQAGRGCCARATPRIARRS